MKSVQSASGKMTVRMNKMLMKYVVEPSGRHPQYLLR